jgi:hypothetical protein
VSRYLRDAKVSIFVDNRLEGVQGILVRAGTWGHRLLPQIVPEVVLITEVWVIEEVDGPSFFSAEGLGLGQLLGGRAAVAKCTAEGVEGCLDHVPGIGVKILVAIVLVIEVELRRAHGPH